MLQGEVEGLRDGRVPRAEEALAAIQQSVIAVQAEVEQVRDGRMVQAEGGLERLHGALAALQAELEGVRDARLVQAESGLAELHEAVTAVQNEVVRVRDERLSRAEADVSGLHQAVSMVQSLAEELRDGRLPAVAARADALLEAVREELAEVAGITERLALNEPLHVAVDPTTEVSVPDAIRRSSLRLITDFRGDKAEISERVSDYVELLRSSQPVLELGPGRGELLEALRDAGIQARGVDSEAPMVSVCRRHGLEVSQGDALQYLEGLAAGSLGAVVAIHVLEHLAPAAWMRVIDESSRTLKPGGTLIVECPNPETLRVGGSLFWIDPTHRWPVHAQAVEFAARAVGLEVVSTRFMRPFPADQALARPGQPDAVFDLASRLDGWLSGPRDFVVVARKPGAERQESAAKAKERLRPARPRAARKAALPVSPARS